MMMRADVKRLSEAEIVGPTDRQTAAIDKVRAMSRRSQALLAAAGQSESALLWYVLRLDLHAEISVDKRLEDAHVERWLPFMKVEDRRRGGRKRAAREVKTVLAWPGYMFVRVLNEARAWAGLRTVKGVVGVLGAGEKPFPVKHEKVLALKAFLEHDVVAIGELAKGLKVGEKVRVKHGPFDRIDAIVCEVSDEGWTSVEVMLFGRAVPLTLDLDQIEKSL